MKPSAHYFEGHFPSFPVLPGVVQLMMVLEKVRSGIGPYQVGRAPRGTPLKSVKKMKFMDIIQPDDDIDIVTTPKSENEIAYEVKKGSKVCSSGILVF